jgi:hypothetical protein
LTSFSATSYVTRLAIMGSTILVGGGDGNIRVFTDQFKHVSTYVDHICPIRAMAISETYCASADSGGSFIVRQL